MTADSEYSENAETKARIFVSYSRKDLAAADRLVSALKAAGFEAYLDRQDIAPGEPWQERLGTLILAADSVVFVLSPNSAASPICAWEVAESERLSKRLLPVIVAPVDDAVVPERMRRLNYIFFTEDRPFHTALETLRQALNADIGWIREHTRIGEIAARWLARDRQEALLLRGADLDDVETWISGRPREAPAPTDLQLTFIQESRKGEQDRAKREREQLDRTRRFQKRAAWALVGIAGLVLAMLANVIFQQRDTQRRTANMFTAEAAVALNGHQYDRAMRYALQAVPPIGDSPWSIGWDEPAIRGLTAKLAGGAAASRLETVLRGHAGPLSKAIFSPDGSKVLTVSDDTTARVWDASSGATSAILKGHSNWVWNGAFSPDGSQVATASEDRTARIWDAASGRQTALLQGHSDVVWHVAFSPDGTRVVTASWDRTARIWDAVSGQELAILKGHSDKVLVAEYSPDGTKIATCSFDGTARIWDAASGNELMVLRGHTKQVLDVAWSPDGKVLGTASEDHTARVWNAADGKQLVVFKGHSQTVGTMLGGLAFSRDGRRIVTVSNDVRVWDASSGAEISVLPGGGRNFSAAAFSPDDARVVTGSDDNTVRVWDVASGRELATLSGHERMVNSAMFSPDGTRILTGSGDGTARLWDATLENRYIALGGVTANRDSSVFNAAGKLLTVRAENKSVLQIRDGANGQLIASLVGHTGDIAAAAFSPDGRTISTAGDRTVRIWEIPSGKAIAVLAGHTGNVEYVAFSPDGKKLLSTADDKTIRVWAPSKNPSEGWSAIAVLKGHSDKVVYAAFSPDGEMIASRAVANDREARIWDARSYREIAVLKGHTYQVNTVIFSPDSSRVVTASIDNTLRIWNPRSGEQIAVLRGHTNGIMMAAFSPDGARIVTASEDNSARIWDASTGREIVVLRGHTAPVRSASYSPDGFWILTAGDDAIRIWDAVTGEESAVLAVPSGQPDSAVFSPDGWSVLGIYEDGAARMWDVRWVTKIRGAQLRDQACAEKLKGGAQFFSRNELESPMLRGVGEDNPCLRRGPLSWQYWARLPADVLRLFGAAMGFQ